MASEIARALDEMVPNDKSGNVVIVPRFAFSILLTLLAVLMLGAIAHAGWLAVQAWALQRRVTVLENDRQTTITDHASRIARLEVEDEKKMALLNRLANDIRDVKAATDFLKGKAERQQ